MSYFVLSYLLFHYLNVSFSRLMTSFGPGRENWLFSCRLLVIMLFLFERVSSSSGCLGRLHLLLWHSLGLAYKYFTSEYCHFYSRKNHSLIHMRNSDENIINVQPTEQPTKCSYHISYGGWGWACKTSLSPPVIHY